MNWRYTAFAAGIALALLNPVVATWMRDRCRKGKR